MAYKHILIAVDLSPESKVLVEKAVSMARPYNAKVSLIHVDVNYSDLYTGLIDVNLGDMQKRISEETHHALTGARCWSTRLRNTTWTWWYVVIIRTSGAS